MGVEHSGFQECGGGVGVQKLYLLTGDQENDSRLGSEETFKIVVSRGLLVSFSKYNKKPCSLTVSFVLPIQS